MTVEYSLAGLSGSGAVKTVRHVELDQSVMSLQEVIDSLNELIDRINGEPLPVENNAKNPDRPMPSFAEVLNGSPAQINDFVLLAKSKIDTIHETLF